MAGCNRCFADILQIYITEGCTVFFFHLQRQALEVALPKLLLKTLRQNWRAALCIPNKKRLEQISDALWAVPHEWILPHGFADAPYPEKQPIWLAETLQRPNNAEVVFLCDGSWQQEIEIDTIQRLCLMIEPADIEATHHARSLWQTVPEEQRKLVKI